MPQVVIGAGVGGLIGGITGAVSAIIQGEDLQGIVAGAIGGAISGAISGAVASTGVGLLAMSGANFIGGAAGSVAENVISTGGENLDFTEVAKDAVIDGGISVVSGVMAKGIDKVATNVHNKFWGDVLAKNDAMDGTWKAVADKALKVDTVIPIVKPVAENTLNLATDVVQDKVSPKVLCVDGESWVK